MKKIILILVLMLSLSSSISVSAKTSLLYFDTVTQINKSEENIRNQVLLEVVNSAKEEKKKETPLTAPSYTIADIKEYKTLREMFSKIFGN